MIMDLGGRRGAFTRWGAAFFFPREKKIPSVKFFGFPSVKTPTLP